MQQKSLLILSVVTVGTLAVAALAIGRRDGNTKPSESAKLFPELSERINDIAELRVEKSGKVATVKKEGGEWRLADRGGYPALVAKVKELALGLADLKIEEVKTSKKSNHAQLGVEWPPAETDDVETPDASFVSLKDANGKELAALILGKSEWRGSKPKFFARLPGGDQVYLCAPRGTLNVMAGAKDWIDAKIVELPNDRLQSVTIEHADGERVEIARSAANHTQFTLQGLAPGQSERYEGVANGVAQTLGTGLQLEDVKPVGEVDFETEPLAKTRFRCVDGLELVFESAKFEDKTWVKVAARFTPPPKPAVSEPEASDGEPSEGATAPEGDAEEKDAGGDVEKGDAEKGNTEKKDVAKEAADLNRRLEAWAFEIGYKAEALTKHRKDLLAVPPPDPGLQGVLDDVGFDSEEPMQADEFLDGLDEPMADERMEGVEPQTTPDDEAEHEPVPEDGSEPE